MKRLSVIFILVAALSSFVMAEETVDSTKTFNNGMSSGGFWIMKDGIAGGFGEFGFSFVDDSNGFVLRDCVSIGGFGMGKTSTPAGGGVIGDRLLIGARYNLSDFVIRSYGTIGASFGMFAGNNHNFFNSPFLLGTYMGGGFELQFTQKSAFVVEFGGEYTAPVGINHEKWQQLNNVGPLLILGYRSYF